MTNVEENVLVCIRIRPLTQAERKSGETAVWRTEGNTIISKGQDVAPATPTPDPVSTVATPLRQDSKTAIAKPTSKPSVSTGRSSVGGSTPRKPTSASTSRLSTTTTSRTSRPSLLTPKASTPKASTPKPTPPAVTPPKTPYAAAKPRVYSYTFDRLFRPSETTQEVYERMAESLVWSAMDGYNATIFAYGQTGSGKTYTMRGTLRRNPGIIPLAIQDVFEYIKQTPEREFLLRVSYFEIYNEVINDLLSPGSTGLQIRESKSKGIYIENLREEIVLSPEQCMSLLAQGESHRHTSATNFNAVSSRSHTIFRVVAESKERQEPLPSNNDNIISPSLRTDSKSFINSSVSGSVRVSCLNLIDLAGSEKASAHKIDPELRRKEGSYINKSLLTLGNVISKLSSSKSAQHIPYRDSKLTRILEPSLRGNARIAIICALSVSSSAFEETHNTLKFASRAKTIKNSAQVNEFMDDKSLIRKYRDEINALKKQLSAVLEAEKNLKKLEELQSEKQRLEQTNTQMLEQLKSQEMEKTELQEKINRLSKLILVSTSVTPSHMFPPISRRKHKKNSSTEDNKEESEEESEEDILSGDDDLIPPDIIDFDEDLAKLSSNIELISDGFEAEPIVNDDYVLLKKNNALLQKKIELLVRETTQKSQQILKLQTLLEDKDKTIESLLKTKVDECQIGEQFALLQRIMQQKHKEEIALLEAALLDKNIELELQMADNGILADEVEQLRQKNICASHKSDTTSED